jgi:hypothetical protein
MYSHKNKSVVIAILSIKMLPLKTSSKAKETYKPKP